MFTWIIISLSSSSSPVEPVSLQYSSFVATPYPHVADAVIFRPFAKLNVGGVKTCASQNCITYTHNNDNVKHSRTPSAIVFPYCCTATNPIQAENLGLPQNRGEGCQYIQVYKNLLHKADLTTFSYTKHFGKQCYWVDLISIKVYR